LCPLSEPEAWARSIARDTRLDRTVAIKILPSAIAANEEVRQRFEREARAVSSLNHPHICSLYDIGRQDGVDFLVMEYIEGETLSVRLKKGALPLDQAINYAIQIAGALDQAHRRGIVHRDLKPGNIMIMRSGAKLLDFGLAKLGESAAAVAAGHTALPTQTALTREGTILGTFQYMAPEQLEGVEADARTDVFAFGATLYEMLTRRKAFEGKSQASLISAIMTAQPQPLSKLQPLATPALEHVVAKCLAKEPEDRWQSARDLEVGNTAKPLRRLFRWQPLFDECAGRASGYELHCGPELARPPQALTFRSAGLSPGLRETCGFCLQASEMSASNWGTGLR